MMFEFDELEDAPLVPGATYCGGKNGGLAGEVLHRLIPGLKNAGGIRHVGSNTNPKVIVLTSTFGHRIWPDRLSVDGRQLTYFGDNKSEDRSAADTIGNRAILSAYEYSLSDRLQSPPILYFVNTGEGFNQLFIGLFALGQPFLQDFEWVSQSKFYGLKGTFENLVVKLSRLNLEEVSRNWIESCVKNGPTLDNAPASWKRWVEDSVYQLAEPNFELAAGVTAARTEEIGKRFLELCEKTFAGDRSSLIWIIATLMLQPVGLKVDEVRKSRVTENFEVVFVHRTTSAIIGTNYAQTIDIRIERPNAHLDSTDGSSFVFSHTNSSESIDVVVTTAAIGIELDRIGVRSTEEIDIFLKQTMT